jgi:hypothetical protein
MEDSEDSTGFAWLVGMTLIIIVLLFLGYFYFRLDSIRKGDEAVELCRKSVDLSSMAHIKGVNVIDTLECPPVDVKITDSKEDAIKRKVADEMADCWYKFGGNTKELYNRNFGTDKFCAVCSYIKFDGSARDRKINGFIEFLTTKNVKKGYGGFDYMTYLSPGRSKTGQLQSDMTIDTGQQYAVVYVYDKTGMLDRWTASLTFGTSSGVVSLIAGIVAGAPILPAIAIASVATIIGYNVGGAVGTDQAATWRSVTVLTPIQGLDTLKCDMLPVKQDSRG